MTTTALLTTQELKRRNRWMFKLHVMTNELLDWASRVYSMYNKGKAQKPEVLEQIFIQMNADMIGHLRKKLEAEGYSVWNAVTYRHHQEFVDDLTYNNRKMKQDIASMTQENDSKQEQVDSLLQQLKDEQKIRVRDISKIKGELEAQIDDLKQEVSKLKKEKEGLLNRYIIETNTTQRYSNKVEQLENEVEELGSNLEVVMNRYPPVSSRSREAVTREMLLENRIAKLQKENDNLLNRLTEAETRSIRHGFPELEPHISPNEAEGPHFSQRLSALYVEEWTNAYEVVKNIYGERKCLIVLMEWLQTCQKLGKDLFEEQRDMLKCETVGFLRKHQRAERKDAALPVSKDGMVHIREYQRKMAPDTIPTFKEVCRMNTIKSIRFKGRNSALDYINKAAELCWMMNFEDPPFKMDFDVKEGAKFNPNKFNPFSKRGKSVDFLVWPVLMSVLDNTVITKGVVQCK